MHSFSDLKKCNAIKSFDGVVSVLVGLLIGTIGAGREVATVPVVGA